MARMIDSDVTKIVFVSEGGLEDINAPTVAELEAGVDITCALVTGYSLGMTGSDTSSERGVCDVGNVTTHTNANYEANLTFFRDDDPEAENAYNNAYELFTDRGIHGYLVRRIGQSSTVPFAAGDVVEVYKVASDYPQYSSGQGADHVKFTQPFGQQGQFALAAEVAAA